MFKPIENQKEIYDLFIKKLSVEKQQLKVAEECNELGKEIIKYYLNPSKNRMDKILDETGDVLNAIDSFCYIHNISIDDIHKARIKKLQNTFNKMKN